MIDSTVLHHAKDIKRYFKFANHARGTDYEWDVEIELSQANGGDERDYLRRSAFEPLYQAALEHSSVKSYHSVSPEEREELKIFVSKRLGIPKEKVGPEEFKQANSWKYPSMIATTLDTGLRPIEVGRAKVSWVNLEDNELSIPKDESTKNEGIWNCSVKGRTAKNLERWLDERASLDKYEDRDELWLTQKVSEYGSKSCNALLTRLGRNRPRFDGFKKRVGLEHETREQMNIRSHLLWAEAGFQTDVIDAGIFVIPSGNFGSVSRTNRELNDEIFTEYFPIECPLLLVEYNLD